MSDPVPTAELPSLEERMDDVRAVLDAVRSERAAIFGASEGGSMSMLFAAAYPERTVALGTFGSTAKRIWARHIRGRRPGRNDRRRSPRGGDVDERTRLGDVAPSVDPVRLAELSRYYRRCASPGAAVALMRMNTFVDVRDVLPTIHVPTVVMHRTDDRDANVEEGRYISGQIPGAVSSSSPALTIRGGPRVRDAILDEIQELVTGVRPTPRPNRVLATVLFTDLVGSTERLTGSR